MFWICYSLKGFEKNSDLCEKHHSKITNCQSNWLNQLSSCQRQEGTKNSLLKFCVTIGMRLKVEGKLLK